MGPGVGYRMGVMIIILTGGADRVTDRGGFTFWTYFREEGSKKVVKKSLICSNKIY